MKFVKADVTPLITVANELVVVARLFALMIDEVATTPLVVFVSTLPTDVKVLVVDEAIAFAREVVAVMPFTVDERITPLVERTFALMIEVELATPLTLEVMVLALEDTPCDAMTDEVAVTPLMVVVKVFPASD